MFAIEESKARRHQLSIPHSAPEYQARPLRRIQAKFGDFRAPVYYSGLATNVIIEARSKNHARYLIHLVGGDTKLQGLLTA